MSDVSGVPDVSDVSDVSDVPDGESLSSRLLSFRKAVFMILQGGVICTPI